MGLPNIDVIFQQKAVSAVARSTRGKIVLIVKDDTVKTFTTATYKLATEVATKTESAKYTPENVQYITDCFLGMPMQVTVVRIDKTGGLIADALTIASKLNFDWIGIAEGVVADQDALATWIKGQEVLKKTYKAVVCNPSTPPNCKHVVDLNNSKVTFTDARGEVTGEKYVSTMLGIFAGLSLKRSATFLQCYNLKSVVEPADINATIDSGKLVLINDEDKVKIGSGVNSLSTIDADNTEDMKQILTIESMDLMLNDIRSTFKNNYCGKYKNSYDNQILFISAINSYFKTLANEEILDPSYNNVSGLNVEAQRLLWLGIGKSEAKTWDEAKVKNMSFKTTVPLLGDVKILGAIENLNMIVNMQ